MRARDISLFVRCIVWDQDPTNLAAVKILCSTKAVPNFSVDTFDHIVHVHAIFDVPHLFKNVLHWI